MMKRNIAALALAASLVPALGMAQSAREIVLAGLDAVFIHPNPDAIDTYFATDYIQHNPMFPNGNDTLKGFAAAPAGGVKYQIGNVVADEDTQMVAVHFRVEGFGPKPMVGFDMFRVEDGKIVEHWDVLQEDVAETASGNPMWTPAAE